MKEISDINLHETIETELGNRFNRQGYINCPFHSDHTPSLSVKFFPDKNKYRYKCFACGASGDAIDFMQNYRNVDYKTARELLGIQGEKTEIELRFDKIISRIDWDVKNSEYKLGYKLLGVFEFVNEQNEIIYYKAKFLKPDGKKVSSYYRFMGDKIINNREGIIDVPYNLYNVLQGIKNGKTIIFVEGEKDANTINKFLKRKNYVATSIKGCKDLSKIKEQRIKAVYVIGDTGQAGEIYVEKIRIEFQEISDSFKIIKLPDLRALGNNKDVTDWIEAGHNLEDLFAAFNRASNLNNKYDFYCEHGKTYINIIKNEEVKKIPVSNFKVIDGKILHYVEDDAEGVKITFRSANGKTIEKSGFSTVFDDVRSFKNFMGSMDLTFYGSMAILNDYKAWINNNYLVDTEEIYSGDRFIELKDELSFVTGVGAMKKDNKIDVSIYAEDSKINIMDIEPIKADSLKGLKDALLGYLSFDKAAAILGTIVNNLAVYQNIKTGRKLHHLLIVGESGSGKSTILEKVIAPILNYPEDNKKTMGSSSFAMLKDLCTGNYPALYDEFKPSMMNKNKLNEISQTLRDLYDRGIREKGNKLQKLYKYEYQRPIIMAGEESYPNAEKALVTRSCIVYVSKAARTNENTEAIRYLMAHEKELNSLGRSIIAAILDLSSEEYEQMQQVAAAKFTDLKDRPQSTACNISVGIEIFNKVLIKNGIDPIIDYVDQITELIKAEVLGNKDDAYSIVEQMLSLFDEMAGLGKVPYIEGMIRHEGEFLYMYTTELVAKVMEYANNSNAVDITPIKVNDFKKQARLSGYIVQDPEELKGYEEGQKEPAYNKTFKIQKKSIRMDRYSIKKLTELGLLVIPNVDSFEGTESQERAKLTLVPNEPKNVDDIGSWL
ncbi:CHC2 zinc finger domain-containing protein [Clostridium beijerinckii]|uniref:CHC2 zinc finger domain-containing protein n=1 Tax=Clostridium beijerinckii TaxID=1520 RepID=UPI00149469AA|nr:CHC2 zinc finger domain-containing protein [Clostridium beijerinckii]NOW08063.1 5S rRNA maturation endonuclease (ribonuclease M5)/ABC-type dipeptide/oligopeptide/nickel transport system ATPase component [Clostridium beijerinckii]NYC05661.1 5S rRNA maturation endonuclease (ribonuclease M5)/ABC-type dipeptide/oligopeptide/nickel transport system ATPase component [Clostridium beijerinckii]